jgi:hypothetical protein
MRKDGLAKQPSVPLPYTILSCYDYVNSIAVGLQNHSLR